MGACVMGVCVQVQGAMSPFGWMMVGLAVHEQVVREW